MKNGKLKEIMKKYYLVRKCSEKKDYLAFREDGITENGDTVTIKDYECEVTFTDKALDKLLNGEHVRLDDYDYYLKEYNDHSGDELINEHLNYAHIIAEEIVDSIEGMWISKIEEYISKNKMCYRVELFYDIKEDCLETLKREEKR